MNIGVVGTGNMGRSLGILLAEQGHAIFFGARNPEQAQKAAALSGRAAQAGSLEEAAQFGDVIIWGVRGIPASQLLKDPSKLDGKILIDMNNNETRTDGRLGPDGESLAEKLQRDVPKASVVKAFNTLPMEVFEVAKEDLQRLAVSVFLAADDAAAKSTVRALVEQISFTPVDLGGLRFARAAEGIADVIRILLGAGIPAPAAISLQTLPQPKTQRLGGRQRSKLK